VLCSINVHMNVRSLIYPRQAPNAQFLQSRPCYNQSNSPRGGFKCDAGDMQALLRAKGFEGKPSITSRSSQAASRTGGAESQSHSTHSSNRLSDLKADQGLFVVRPLRRSFQQERSNFGSYLDSSEAGLIPAERRTLLCETGNGQRRGCDLRGFRDTGFRNSQTDLLRPEHLLAECSAPMENNRWRGPEY
jgi:hypothetical protein